MSEIARDEHVRALTNTAADREFRRLAAKVKRISLQCDDMAYTEMGLLTERLARRFHKANALLLRLNHDLQQVVVELDKLESAETECQHTWHSDADHIEVCRECGEERGELR